MHSLRACIAMAVLGAWRQYREAYATTSYQASKNRQLQYIYEFQFHLLIMVVFLPRSESPNVVQVFSTLALTANLTSLFHRDFNIGTFAQFGDANTLARIDHRSERTEFRNLSHLAIRQLLDAENFKDDFILIDKNTPQNQAIWWIVSTETCELVMDPVISYPRVDFVLWQIHMLIRDLAYEYDGISSGETQI